MCVSIRERRSMLVSENAHVLVAEKILLYGQGKRKKNETHP